MRDLLQNNYDFKTSRDLSNIMDHDTIWPLLLQFDSKRKNLLNLSVQELNINMGPPFLPNTIYRVGQNPSQNPEYERLTSVFVENLDKHYSSKLNKYVEKFSGQTFKLYLMGIELSIRNVPSKPLAVKFVSFEAKYVKALFKKDVCDPNMISLFGNSKLFYESKIFMEDLRLSGGLNLVPQYKSIGKFVSKLLQSREDSPAASPGFESSSRKKKKPEEKRRASFSRLPKQTSLGEHPKEPKKIMWWDKLRMNYHGTLQLKVKKFSVDVLTHTSPLIEDCLRLSSQSFYLSFAERKINVLFTNMYLSKMEQVNPSSKTEEKLAIPEGMTSIFKIPKVEAIFRYKWNLSRDQPASSFHYFIIKKLQDKATIQPQWRFISDKMIAGFSLNIPNEDDAEKARLVFPNNKLQMLIEASPVPIIHYQSSLVDSLISLPQLSHEYLILQGIKPPVDLKVLDDANLAKKERRKTTVGGDISGDFHNEDGNKSISSQRGRHQTLSRHFPQDIVKNVSSLVKNFDQKNEFSSYVDLVAFTLNEQINTSDQGSLFKILSRVQFKVNFSTVRFFMTNLEKIQSMEVHTRKDDPERYKLIGLQSVLNSFTFKNYFYKKMTRIDKMILQTLLKSSKNLKRWATEKGEGFIRLGYASFFDGRNLLSLRPAKFEEKRKQDWEMSMENPKVFDKFFGIKDKELKASKSSANHIFDVGLADIFKPNFFNEELDLMKEVTPKHRRKTSFGVSPLKLFGSIIDSKGPKKFFPGNEQPTSQKSFPPENVQEPKSYEKCNLDFDFSSVGGFLEANSIEFKQEVMHAFTMLTDDDQPDTREEFFENFLKISSCKLLIGQNLSSMVSLLINDPIKAIKKKLMNRNLRNKDVKQKFANEDIANYFKRDSELNTKTAFEKKTRMMKEIKELDGDLSEKTSKKNVNIRLARYHLSNERVSFPFGVSIENPQMSFFKEELGSQILFTSYKGFLIYSRVHHLQYDFYKQDPKSMICFNCDDLGIFSAPPLIDFHKKIFWKEDRVPTNLKPDDFAEKWVSGKPSVRKVPSGHEDIGLSSPTKTPANERASENPFMFHVNSVKPSSRRECSTGWSIPKTRRSSSLQSSRTKRPSPISQEPPMKKNSIWRKTTFPVGPGMESPGA